MGGISIVLINLLLYWIAAVWVILVLILVFATIICFILSVTFGVIYAVKRRRAAAPQEWKLALSVSCGIICIVCAAAIPVYFSPIFRYFVG